MSTKKKSNVSAKHEKYLSLKKTKNVFKEKNI